MTELERALHELRGEVAWPAAPDVAGRVRARIDAARERAPRPRPRRALVVALAVLAVAVAGVLAVPPARTAVLEWLGIGGVSVERVPTLPEATTIGLDLGEEMPLARARELVAYRIVLPAVEGGTPERVYVRFYPPGGQVALLLEGERGRRLLFTVFRGEDVAVKMAGPGTRVEELEVDGEPGVWLSGRPHTIVFSGSGGNVETEEIRLAGNVLLWERDGLTLRLEGDVTKERALEIARSVRPVE